MSTSSDSADYHFKLESSRLVSLFEEMQAVGFSMSTLEQNVERLKKGAPAIFFAIYKHLYRAFRPIFDELNVTLEPHILNSKVIDREGFARTFFQVLRESIKHDQVLPLYQYICPGHPVAKTEEVVEVSRKLRELPKRRNNSPAKVDAARIKRVSERLAAAGGHESFSSNRSIYGSETGSFSQPLHPARIASPPEGIHWHVVRETARPAVPVADTDGEEQSPDEGFRSRNPSSLKHLSVDSRKSRRSRSSSQPDRPASASLIAAMDKDTESGFRAVLDRFEQTEALQNLKFRSIEDRLIRMEHDLNESTHKVDQSTADRLNDHEIRIRKLEQKYISENLPRSQSESLMKSTAPAPIRDLHSPKLRPESPPSPPPSPEKERRHTLMNSTPSRSVSVSRSFIHITRERDMLRDSGISSTLHDHDHHKGHLQHELTAASHHLAESHHKHPEEKHLSQVRGRSESCDSLTDHHSQPNHYHRESTHRLEEQGLNRIQGGTGSHESVPHTHHHHHHEANSDHHEPTYHHQEDKNLREEIESRIRGRPGSRESLSHVRSKRNKSVGPIEIFDRILGETKEHHDEESGALLDLNERVQLRLRERIKTAEDTLNACMETIKKDYVLLRRHN